ncbi:MAG: o-succinylbenzoate--CoA ligase [Candidatus Marinimicrobia bacterium]|nr:o-succinylbenzoate--CoA ligase [Candidatus Neomarinimicrobiota bacterium]
MNSGESMEHPLFNAATQCPDQSALIIEGQSLNYDQLFQSASKILAWLTEQGLRTGDIVVLDMLQPQETIFSFWACSLGGFIAFPVNTRFPVATLQNIIHDVQAKLIISNRDLDPDLTISFNKLLTGSGTSVIEQNEFDPFKAISLLMTSGSSGDVKIVQHSLANHVASAMGSNQNIPLKPGDRWLLTLPLYHVGGLSILFRTALSGASIAIPSADEKLIDAISKFQVSHMSLVTIQLQRLLDESEADKVLAGMKAILLGGSSIPSSLIEASLQKKLPIHTSYGSTEMASQICTTSPGNRSSALKSSGQVLSGGELLISHEGEILVKGDTLAMGYREGTEISNFRDSQGWFHTGDVGYLDIDGSVTITGRMDNQFISGGENIQPEYIEMALLKIPGIIQAIVLPKIDPEFGYRPVAYLKLEKSCFMAQTILDQLKKSLPGYMIPISFFHLPSDFFKGEMKTSRHKLAEFLTDPNNHLHPIN